MQFQDVLSDIEKLVGKQLQSVNPKTAPIFLTKIDNESKKYFISSNSDEEGNTRYFGELEAIWSELTHKGFCSVDQALFGGGTSRNQPETIFANLPYIQHFRYQGKKHIFLRGTSVHELGTLSELTGDELTLILSKIDNYFTLSNLDISTKQTAIISRLCSLLKTFEKNKINSNIDRELRDSLDALSVLKNTVSDTVVTVNGELNEMFYEKNSLQNRSAVLSIEELIEDENFTGIENEIIEGKTEGSNTISIMANSKMELSPQEGPKAGLRIRHITPVLTLIHDRMLFDEIELQPDFQRKDRIWTRDKQSKLIESILMGLPLPAFYFAEKSNGDWIVVDGLQRITTVFDFMQGEFSLGKFESFSGDYEGQYFADLSRLEKRKIREYQITAHVIDAESDKENLIVELFHRINTYGVRLSDQEIRSAMNQGSSVTFLRYLSSSNDFINATDNKIKPQRQKDMDLCLTALSYIAFGYQQFDYKTYDLFLSSTMKEMNLLKLFIDELEGIDEGQATLSPKSSKDYFELERKFLQGVRLARDIFGKLAFKKMATADRSAPISKPLFELIVSFFGNLSDSQIKTLKDSSDEFIYEFYNAISENATEFSIWDSVKYEEENKGFMDSISVSTSKRVTVHYRFESFKNIIKKSTGINVDIIPVLGK